MVRFGWILMPCRTCGVPPGDRCAKTRRIPGGRVQVIELDKPHAVREQDAERASELAQ